VYRLCLLTLHPSRATSEPNAGLVALLWHRSLSGPPDWGFGAIRLTLVLRATEERLDTAGRRVPASYLLTLSPLSLARISLKFLVISGLRAVLRFAPVRLEHLPESSGLGSIPRIQRENSPSSFVHGPGLRTGAGAGSARIELRTAKLTSHFELATPPVDRRVRVPRKNRQAGSTLKKPRTRVAQRIPRNGAATVRERWISGR
jgi:hypothetical protein